MQPLLQLLRWEHDIVKRLMDELHLYHYDARNLLDSHPQLIREAWLQKRSSHDTADQLIAHINQETSHHD